MKYIPKQASLSELIYRGIEKNEYLEELYTSLLYNYAVSLFDLGKPLKLINKNDALRYADLLAKSSYAPTKERDHQWGQEIATLLKLVYPGDEVINYYLGSVLSAVGNYRGLKATEANDFQSLDPLDRIFYDFDKEIHHIPDTKDEFFFRNQKMVFDGLSNHIFSYSGPTSMGKSFVVQTYIKQQIKNGQALNYAILVPTKALINEVRKSFFDDLQNILVEQNYRIVSAVGEIYLQQKHNFIFIMTPERMHHLLIEQKELKIDFLFIDEAHKISERGGRGTYYYKVLAQLRNQKALPTIIFASPYVPNPEEYLRLIPGADLSKSKKFVSKYTPVTQFKFYLDFFSHDVFVYNDYAKSFEAICHSSNDFSFSEIIQRVGREKQNVVYCSSCQRTIELAIEYAKEISPLDNANLKKLANDVRQDVHRDCYLASLIEKGIAYHVGYLPTNIRIRIEEGFEAGDLRTIFCTSTLVEGVNLPADNLFITNYRNGSSNMDEVEFRNLVGRVGRIKYNLYGNVFLLRMENRSTEGQYKALLQNEVPNQKLSLDLDANKKHIPELVRDLVLGDVELKNCHKKAKEKDFDALRKFALILVNDYAKQEETPITQMFEEYVTQSEKTEIIKNFPKEKTNEDITLSYDQVYSLRELIQNGAKYPKLHTEDSEIIDVDFEEVVEFLKTLSRIFKWGEYEKTTIGKSENVLRWYATILLKWIRGNGLSSIIDSAIKYKELHPNTGVWVGNNRYADAYDYSLKHKNYIIAETLGIIENVLLFSLSNYFRQFSIEYKNYHNLDYFDNDWYEYVEYGTTNEVTRFLQRVGFSREAATYLANHRERYVIETENSIKLRKAVLKCNNPSVEFDSKEIQFNMPELFVD